MPLVATCHCGATRIEVSHLPESLTACNCTFCSKRGALWAYYDPSEITMSEGPHGDYSASGLAHHHFCAVCGCTTMSHTLDWSQVSEPEGGWVDATVDSLALADVPRKVSVNARLFNDLDLRAIPLVELDGRSF